MNFFPFQNVIVNRSACVASVCVYIHSIKTSLKLSFVCEVNEGCYCYVVFTMRATFIGFKIVHVWKEAANAY